MQTFSIDVKDELVPIFLEFIAGFDKDEIQVADKLHSKSIEKKRDLSRLVAHPNIVNGNSDDLVGLSWEKEINLDFPD
ncbi:MAG: hypothetical protein Q4G13_03880 [Moraxella sp.]|nr:hypothetical protein [Moraxella sp.]